MTDLNLLGYPVLIAMLIVVSSQVLRRNLDVGGKLGGIDDGVLDLALFRNRVRVARLVAFVKRLQFVVRRVQAFAQILLLQDCIVELYFGVLLDELVMN